MGCIEDFLRPLAVQKKPKDDGSGQTSPPSPPVVTKQWAVKRAGLVKTTYLETSDDVNGFLDALRKEIEQASVNKRTDSDSIIHQNRQVHMCSWSRWHAMKALEKSGFKRSSMFSRPELKGRGWTDAMIRKFLPSEDATAPNPEYVSAGSPMKLYRRNRVKRIEASEKFQEAMQAAAKRKKSASKAVTTKLSKTRAYLDKLAIDVPKLEKMALITASQLNFNSLRLPERVELSDERKCVNYLRHCCTKYERELAAIAGKTGANTAYYDIKEKVLNAIADQYEWLADECERQVSEMWKKSAEQYSP